ncbi:MAG: hypothetical protein QOH32_2882 [Bradyrhizobium sp.]|nr:hypothetical protein [Bradyrhizobium sp.]
MQDAPVVAMVFAGGLGLAAYHAGAWQAFSETGMPLHWVAGSSAGAVMAALIAGNRSEQRLERLRAFWNFPPVEDVRPSPWRHINGWMGAIGTRLTGSRDHFHPRFPPDTPFGFRSLYDLAPMQQRIAALVDFGHLNSAKQGAATRRQDTELRRQDRAVELPPGNGRGRTGKILRAVAHGFRAALARRSGRHALSGAAERERRGDRGATSGGVLTVPRRVRDQELRDALHEAMARFYVGRWTSGARGVTSGDRPASIWDFRSAAFSTSAAATFGSWVDCANLRRVAA